MALVLNDFSKLDAGFSNTTQQLFGYISSADTLATIAASGYFNNLASTFRQYDIIHVQGADPDVNIYQITSATGATTVTIASIIDTSIIPDGAITNAKVNVAAAIAWSKMAALTEGNLLLGSAGNVATVTDFSANAQIGVGDGTTFNPVAMSGDVAIDNAGATTIQSGAIDLGMLSAGITPSHVVRFAGKHSYGGGGTTDAATVTGVVAGDIVVAMIESKTNAGYLDLAVPTTDTVTFTFSADPGASTVVSYVVLNAAS